jgi:hypothetical protein
MKFPAVAVAIAVALSCAVVSPRIQAQWWNPQDINQPKDRGTPWEKKPTYDHHFVEIAQSVIWQAIQSEDFAKIDRMYVDFTRDKIRNNEGIPMVDAFRRALSELPNGKDEAQMRAFFAAWREKSPGSRLLPIAEADGWAALAWKARGGGTYGEVTQEGRELFQQRLRQATRALEASADVGKDDPLWYYVALVVAGASGRPGTQFDALYEEATTKFPTYLALYYTRVNFLLPEWGGSWDKVDALVQDAVKRTQATDGTSMYARIYTNLASTRKGNVFEYSNVQWAAMRNSFEDMVKRFPDPWNRQLYLSFACLARDKETTARLMSQNPGDQVFPWGNSLSTDGCRRFAFDRT